MDTTKAETATQQSLSATCPQGLYISPTSQTVANPSKPLDILWDPTCFKNSTSLQVDLYGDGKLVHEWEVLDSDSGQLSVDLNPAWWNDTTPTSMYVDIIPLASSYNDTSPFPAGPAFTLGNATSATPPAAPSSSSTGEHFGPLKLTKPQLVAAIVAPVLTVAVLGSVIWAILRARAKTERERRAWEEGIRPVSRY